MFLFHLIFYLPSPRYAKSRRSVKITRLFFVKSFVFVCAKIAIVLNALTFIRKLKEIKRFHSSLKKKIARNVKLQLVKIEKAKRNQEHLKFGYNFLR